MSAHEVQVNVISPEAAEYGMAEFWIDDEVFGITAIEDCQIVLRIEPRSDGGAVVVNARSLEQALLHAKQLLESY
ncbi:MAG: hypothetical protein QOE08_1945 [Thermoleophilaceae bacterium]|jgi:hypothetical protein|nr:hypothetical protein [Thermoleophilaceae bacterium]